MLGISAIKFYKWKAKFGGMNVSEAQRLCQLEQENIELKRSVADLSLDITALKDVLSKNGKARCQASRKGDLQDYVDYLSVG